MHKVTYFKNKQEIQQEEYSRGWLMVTMEGEGISNKKRKLAEKELKEFTSKLDKIISDGSSYDKF